MFEWRRFHFIPWAGWRHWLKKLLKSCLGGSVTGHRSGQLLVFGWTESKLLLTEYQGITHCVQPSWLEDVCGCSAEA